MRNFTQIFQNWLAEIELNSPEYKPKYQFSKNLLEDTSMNQKAIAIPLILQDLHNEFDFRLRNPFYFPLIVNHDSYFLLSPNAIAQVGSQNEISFRISEINKTDLSDFDSKKDSIEFSNPSWIPFAQNKEGDYLIFATNQNENWSGQIFLITKNNSKSQFLAKTITDFFQTQIDLLQAESANLWNRNLLDENAIDETTINSLDIIQISVVPFASVKNLIPQDSWYFKEYEKGRWENVYLVRGNWDVENLNLSAPFSSSEHKVHCENQSETPLILVQGNLKAKNIYVDPNDTAMGLMVLGRVTCENMFVSGQQIYILEDLNVSECFWGDSLMGNLQVECEVFAKVFVCSNYFNCNPKKDNIASQYLFCCEESDLNEKKCDTLSTYFIEELFPDFAQNNPSDKWDGKFLWEQAIPFLKIGKSILNTTLLTSEHIHKATISKLFSDYHFTTEKELQLQWHNFNKIIGYLDDTNPSQEFKSSSQKATICIHKSNSSKDSSKFTNGQIKILLEDGYEIYLRLKKWCTIQSIFKTEIALVAEYKKVSENLSEAKSVFENDKMVEIVKTIWLEIIELIEKGIYYKEEFYSIIDGSEILEIVQHPIIKSKFNYWNNSERENIGLGDYKIRFQIPSSKGDKASIQVIKNANRQGTQRSFEYAVSSNKKNTNLYLAYAETEFEGQKNNSIQIDSNEFGVFQWKLWKEAKQFWLIAKATIRGEIENYVVEKKPHQCEILYHEYYKKKPIPRNKLAAITYKNIKILAEFCKNKKNSLSNDYFVIIRDYHWISVQFVGVLEQELLVNEKPFNLVILDEPFGNNTHSENYAALHYSIAIDDEDQLKLNCNAEMDFDLHKTLQFLLYKLIDRVEKETIRLERETKKNTIQAEVETKRKANRKAQYAVGKPMETVYSNGQQFQLLNRVEAERYLSQCTDFKGNLIYDPFEMFPTDGNDDYLKNGFFLLAENEMEFEILDLNTRADSVESSDLYVLGYIFNSNLTIRKCLNSYDLDYSPPIICFGNAFIFNAFLSGNSHYFHKNLNCEFLYGKHNYGDLIVKENTIANAIYTDDFKMYLNKIKCWAICSNYYDITGYDRILNKQEVEMEVCNVYLGTHNLNEILLDKHLLQTEYGVEIKETETESFYAFLQNGESPIDYDKLNIINETSVQNFEIRIQKIINLPEIKRLKNGEILEKGKEGNCYYYLKNDLFFKIGKWFLHQHIEVSIVYFYEGRVGLNLTYFEDDNSTIKCSFDSKITDNSIVSLVVKRIFREAEKSF